MSKTITQRVIFPGATAKAVYGVYMSSKKHAEATGAPAELSRAVGDKFTAHNKHIKGRNLAVQANKMVVQTWRAKGWDRAHGDSVLTLRFADTDEGCELEMVHACVPDEATADLKKGWNKMYWSPFKKYLKKNAS
ncbi:MAG: SRPBCC domain-containing protein [Nannocystaceae bacterium]